MLCVTLVLFEKLCYISEQTKLLVKKKYTVHQLADTLLPWRLTTWGHSVTRSKHYRHSMGNMYM
jgi:hypothetical protein